MKTAILACAVLVSSAAFAAAQTEQHSSAQTTTTHSGGAFSMGASKCRGPMNVSSDAFEGDMQTKVGTYSGNVIAVQATCKLRADKIVAEAVSGNDLNRLTATGNVVFNSSSGTAIGDNGVYDLGPKLLTLTGKVVLTKGKDVMRGTKLVVDVNTGIAHLTAKGMPGGRVQSSFIPKQNEGSDSPPPKSKPAGDDGN
jgi:lipopolysaccharide export system protein LptA